MPGKPNAGITSDGKPSKLGRVGRLSVGGENAGMPGRPKPGIVNDGKPSKLGRVGRLRVGGENAGIPGNPKPGIVSPGNAQFDGIATSRRADKKSRARLAGRSSKKWNGRR